MGPTRAPTHDVTATPKPADGRRAERADWFGLTHREREVLELLAAGRSDAEIAAALVLSPNPLATT